MKSAPPISERELRDALNTAGSPEKAAIALNRSRRTVYRWMEFYGISRQSQFAKVA